MLKHIMLNIETWGTKPYSMIVMIGACVFDPYMSMPAEIIQERFEVAINPKESQGVIDPETILWWMSTDRDQARALWWNRPWASLAVALDGFEEWLRSLGDTKELRIWGNDNTLLRQAYEGMKREVPWEFRHDRCFRTLRAMLTDETLQYLGTQHTALADAENQAIRANQIVRRLGIKLT